MTTEQLERPPAAGLRSRLTAFSGRLWDRIEQGGPYRRCLGFYRKHERFAPALFFFGGAAWDAATLKRIDAWVDDLLLMAYLLMAGAAIMAAVLVEYGRVSHPWLLKGRAWYPALIQFFFGALFSAYVVFYAQSASFSESSLYLVLLAALLVSNEFIHRRLVNLYVLFALFFLSGFSFFIFYVPVLVKQMNYATFLAGGALSAGLVAAMLWHLKSQGVFQTARHLRNVLLLIAGLFVLFNGFYLLNWIPPVPLALRHGGIYHHVERVPEKGAYELWYESPPWHRFWSQSDRVFRRAEGEPVYCFTAVFAPTRLTKTLYHQWSRYDAGTGRWTPSDRMTFRVEGMRDRGYRWYSRKRNLEPGRWRVDVRTEEGLILGRIRFMVEQAEAPAANLKHLTYP